MSILCSMVGATFGVAAVAQILRSKKGITAVGNAQIDTAQSQFGGASALFDGTGDRLDIASHSSLAFGTTDFTIECWIRYNSTTGNQTIIDFRSGSSVNILLGNDGGAVYLYVDGAYRIGRSGTQFVTGQFYHLALSRSGTSTRLFINGTQVHSTYTDTNSYVGNDPSIGENWRSSGFGTNGWIDEFRISNSARYTANFTPSTVPFVNDANTLLLIHADGTDGTTFFEDDNSVRTAVGISAHGGAALSSTQSKFGSTSLGFGDGVSDFYKVYPNSTSYFGGSGDMTFEFWYWRAATASGLHITDFRPNGQDGACWTIVDFEDGRLGIRENGYIIASNIAVPTQTWTHIAIVKQGTTMKWYKNGTNTDTTTGHAATFNNRTDCFIGANYADQSAGNNLNGYIDELRISNSARYTANFTAPTVPFVNDANTLLLIHADGTNGSTVIRDDAGAVPVAITTTSAVAFDGTNDYYSATGLTTTATDSKYLTIAFTWFHNSGGNSRNQHFMTARLGTTNGENGWEVCIQSGRFRYSSYDNSGSNTDLVYGDYAGPTENAWNQIVAYIDHTSFANCKYFLNGVDRTSSLLNGSGVGAVNLANLNINWGSSNVSIRIGEQDPTAGYNSGFDDFLGSISQIYCHNAAGAPDISKFWQQGKPQDLGTNGTATGLVQPLIYHYGGTATFAANNGTGFNSYTLTANGNISSSTNNSIYQLLRTQKGVAAVGNAQLSTAQSKFGGSSYLGDGTGDVLRTYSTNLTTGNFTIEFWVYATTVTGDQHMFSVNGPGTAPETLGLSFLRNGTTIKIYASPGNAQWDIFNGVSIGTISVNTWAHLAITRNGSTWTGYVNGVATSIGTSASNLGSSGFIDIGGLVYGGVSSFTGHIDEVRVSNVARYTANFTPSTTPFQNDANTLLLLHMDGTNASTVLFDDNGIAPYTP